MNTIIVKMKKENLLIDGASIMEFKAPYGKGELRATLDTLRKEIFDYIEDDYTTIEYDCVGVFLNGTQAHIFDDEYLGFWGCGIIPAV